MKKRKLAFLARITNVNGKPRLDIEGVDRTDVAPSIWTMFGDVNGGRVLLTVTEAETSGDNRPTLAWFHGYFLPMAAKAMRETTGDGDWDADKLKETLKETYLPLNAEGLVPSLSDLTDSELKEFIERSKDFVAEWSGMVFPERENHRFPTE